MKTLSLLGWTRALPLGVLLWVTLSACEGEPPASPGACAKKNCSPGVCEEQNGEAVCTCPAGYMPTVQGCSPQQPENGDDHGDTPATATAIVPRRWEAQLGDRADVDVFAFRVVAGRIYRFTCNAPFFGYDSTCAVRLLDATGESIASTGLSWQAGYEAPATGIVYAEVRHATASNEFPVTYVYALEDVGPDDHGDTPETATELLPLGTPFEAQIEQAGDVDVFAFEAVAGHVYHFRCTDRWGCSVKLRDATGALLHEQLSGGLDYNFVTAGRYTLEVSFLPLLLASNVGPYHYSLEDAGPDDHGGTAATATDISFGEATAAKFETPLDVDVFRFTAPAGQVVRFTCSSTDLLACAIRLKSSEGRLLDDRRGFASYEAGPLSEVLFAEVSHPFASGASTYFYLLEGLGPDDFGDSPATASTLWGSPAEVTGKIETGSDSDFFRQEVPLGHFYRATCIPTGMDCGLRMHGPNGPVLETLRVPLEFKAITHPLLVEVFGIFPQDRGTYVLRVEDLGADDHGDNSDTATRLTLDTPISGNLDATTDIDVFVVTLEMGRTYELTAPSGTVNGTVRDPFGPYVLNDVVLNTTPRTFTAQYAGDHLVEVRKQRDVAQTRYQIRLR